MRNDMSRRAFLTAGAASAASPLVRASSSKPNFLIILADDMGYSDAGCYGGDIDTPNIDSLAKGGLRFTQGYSTARCGPSRSSILTGYYAQQTASDVMTPGNIPAWTRFLPQQLKPLGYRTYHSGKWHIRFMPVAGAAFDHSYTEIDQNRFFTPESRLLDDQRLPVPKESDGYYATQSIGSHAVKWLETHGKQHSNDPFFLYLPFTSPHFPLHALQEDIERYKDRFAEGWDVARERRWQRMRRMGLINCQLSPLEPGMWTPWNTPDDQLTGKIGPGEVMRAVPWSSLTPEQKKFQRIKMAIHAAMITRMDIEIGRVIAKLKAMNAFDNTVVMFISDNGASSEQLIRGDGHDASAPPGSARTHLCLGPGWASAANAPFRLHKSWVHEGGISSPWIMHWPAGIKDPGRLRHNPCHFVDIAPTLVDLAGGKPLAPVADGAPVPSGRSLKPALARDGSVPHDYLYFHHNNNRALRVNDWKLVAAGINGPWELYDLKKDRAEQQNLAAKEPARVNDMAALWRRTDETFVKTRESSPPIGNDVPRLITGAGANAKGKRK
ncbi:MAG: arylsulfatase [Bryobacterales bacterium]|nr:arylsulfatase [Bryobacterales bacterium]